MLRPSAAAPSLKSDAVLRSPTPTVRATDAVLPAPNTSACLSVMDGVKLAGSSSILACRVVAIGGSAQTVVDVFAKYFMHRLLLLGSHALLCFRPTRGGH